MIPENIKQAVKVIRKHVPKPETLPGPNRSDYAIIDGQLISYLRWNGRCPLGLLPTAKTNCPVFASDVYWVDGLQDQDVAAFANWWDRQSDPVAALEIVWDQSIERII